jgi:hypothetical protein
MNYTTLVDTMLSHVPEVRPFYEKEISWYEKTPGPHIIFGDVVNPWLRDLLVSNGNAELLGRLFGLFELMAESNDANVKEVLAFSVLESLGDDPNRLHSCWGYMGPLTRQLSDEVENWLGRKQ